MAAVRLIPIALRAAPPATLAFLGVWLFADVLSVGSVRSATLLLGIEAVGVVALAVGSNAPSRPVQTFGLLLLGADYILAHAFSLGVDLVPALVFVAFLIVQVELRVLAERFAPLYETSLRPEARRRIDAALGRAVIQLTVAAALSIVVPILAADLAVAGVAPLTTIPTAIALAAALVAVVMVLALLPVFERRTA